MCCSIAYSNDTVYSCTSKYTHQLAASSSLRPRSRMLDLQATLEVGPETVHCEIPAQMKGVAGHGYSS